MAGERGRIVMLVDNGVTGDSRVQKEAISAAAAGWDVVLLGKSPTKHEQKWRLGGAQVRLLPVATPLAKRRHEYRRAPLRSPFAYPAGRLPAYREQKARARRAELRVEQAKLRVRRAAGASRPVLALAAVRQVLPRLKARLALSWVGFRTRRTLALRDAQKRMDGRLDRMTTSFWLRVMGDRAWRRLDPGLWDYELAYGGVVDRLKPDIIHANDFRMLGVGARSMLRRRAAGERTRLVWDAHEYLPGIKPWSDHPRWHPAQCAHEKEYAPYADSVVTVSETLADMLVRRHGLAGRPAVVLNAPDLTGDAEADDEDVPDLRAQCGIGPKTPLVVYSGAAAPQRGLGTMIEALPALDDVHVALVVLKPQSPYVSGLRARAAELGVADRVHTVGYVPHHQVVRYLSAADVGVIPIHHWPNHEIALITKFFEYSHARLPLVVSDVQTMGDMTRSTGQGEVFTAEDVEDYVRAVKSVLGDPERYRKAYDVPGRLEEWTWRGQAAVLDRVYEKAVRGDGEDT